MSLKQRCFFIYGNDSYLSYKRLKAIEARFLSKDNSMTDLMRYDLDDTPVETIRQTLLTQPFLVTHRLFILKNVFGCNKAELEALQKSLEQTADSTVIVIYESKTCDQRLSFFKWLTTNAAPQECTMPTGAKLGPWIASVASDHKVTLEPAARNLLELYYPEASWQLVQEIKKLALYAASQQRATITKADVELLCANTSSESLFRITDALRDSNYRALMESYRTFVTTEEPIVIAATLASHIRALTKIHLCLEQGITDSATIAKKTGVNPYVLKLTLPQARTLSSVQIKKAYAALLWFEEAVKTGLTTGDIALLLLIHRLHGTLKTRTASART